MHLRYCADQIPPTMNSTNRRTFIHQTATALTGLMALDLVSCSAPNQAWGIQLFSIPRMAAGDLPGTLRRLQELGYREVEFFGPYPFSAPETIEGWKSLSTQMDLGTNAFYGYTVEDVRTMLGDYGLRAPSVHLDLITLRKNLKPAMEQLAILGTRYVAIPALMGQPISTAGDFERFAEEFNGFGKDMKEFGIKLVYHNHGYEHAVRDGKVPMEILLQQTDPETVVFELDIFWMQAAGASPIEFLQKYPGRFKLMHIKDAAEAIRFSGDGSTPDQWMPLFPKMADPGTGVFDIPGIIQAGITSGVEHFHLERDLTPTPEQTLSASIAYFKSLQLKS